MVSRRGTAVDAGEWIAGKSLGEQRMKTRIPVAYYPVMIGIVLVLLMGKICFAEHNINRGGEIEGFRGLKWGASLEQASKIYQDLDFEKYVISNSKEEPWKVYVRRAEHGDIENVTFDSIEYWFRGDHFIQVRALLQSRIGPRTLVTRAEDAFDKINGRLRNRYGNPSADKVNYVTEFIVVVKEATWIVDHSAVIIKYEGAGKTNEDLLTLIIQEKPIR